MSWQATMSGSALWGSAWPIRCSLDGFVHRPRAPPTHPSTATPNLLYSLFSIPVSVGPAGFPEPPAPGGEAGAPGPETREKEGAPNSQQSAAAPPSRPGGGIAAAGVATVAAGRMGAGAARGRRRGFAEFSEQARVRLCERVMILRA